MYRRMVLFFLLSGVLLVFLIGSPLNQPTQVQAQSNWNLVWQDNFNGAIGSLPNSANWGHELGGHGFGNGELQYYTNEAKNAQIVSNTGAQDGRALEIKAIYEPNVGLSCWYGPCQYTSARLLTRNKMTWTFGRFEMRAKTPTAPGAWPAFWLLGADIGTVGWPQCGEIDIMEQIGLHPDWTYGVLHGPGYSGGASIGATYSLPGNVPFSNDWHVYAMEWEPGVVRWYVDGVLFLTRTPANLPAGAQWVYDHPMFIILNFAVGNNAGWPGVADPAFYPRSFFVDYVRVYQNPNLPTLTPTRTPGASTPYTGTPVAVPGTIQAENYDLGGEWNAYHDFDPGNNGNQYRTEGVDIEATTDAGGGYNVGFMVAGDWMKYTVNVQTSGTYRLDLRVANQGLGGTFHIEQDGVDVTGPITIPDTGAWQTFTTMSKAGVNLTAGRRVLRFVMDNGNGSAGNGNLNWFSFTLTGGSLPTNTPPAATATRTRTNTPVVAPSNTPVTGSCGTTNVALNKPATSSGNEAAGTTPNLAVDGNPGTRWSSAFSDPQWIRIDLGSTQTICRVRLNWEGAYGRSYQIQVSNDGTNWTTIYSTTTGDGGIDDLTGLSGSGRYIRMNGTVRATGYGYSLWEFEVYTGSSTATNTPVAPTPTRTRTNTPVAATATRTNTPVSTTCGATNIALNRPATSSGNEAVGTTPNLAVDGVATSRWSSAFSDPQWIQIDLGTTRNICRVRLNWEGAYGRSYQIQVSSTGTSWTPIYSTTTGDGGIDDLTGLSGSGRYIRMYGTVRALPYGYSLWEFEVYATP